MRMTTVAGSTKGARLGESCLRPLQRRKHRNGRRNDRVARKQRRTATPRKKISSVRLPSALCASAISDRMPPSPLLSACMREQHIFGRHRDDERPDDQRDDADDLARRQAGAGDMGKARLQRIERAGADYRRTRRPPKPSDRSQKLRAPWAVSWPLAAAAPGNASCITGVSLDWACRANAIRPCWAGSIQGCAGRWKGERRPIFEPWRRPIDVFEVSASRAPLRQAYNGRIRPR